jgi:hypothetical protein
VVGDIAGSAIGGGVLMTITGLVKTATAKSRGENLQVSFSHLLGAGGRSVLPWVTSVTTPSGFEWFRKRTADMFSPMRALLRRQQKHAYLPHPDLHSVDGL